MPTESAMFITGNEAVLSSIDSEHLWYKIKSQPKIIIHFID